MKILPFVKRLVATFILPVFALSILPSCTHDDKVEIDLKPPSYTYGTSMVNNDEGWAFDKAHSNVMWETAYLGSAALLTGRFNSFVAEMTFDEDNPENTSFIGKVTLSSVNTGEPNRDGGCLLNTFGTADSDEAVLTSKSVTKDGKGGYIAVADLSFHGNVKEVQLALSFSGVTYFGPETGLNGTPFSVVGFTAEFEFNAKTDFGIASANIADKVLVRINTQFKKKG